MVKIGNQLPTKSYRNIYSSTLFEEAVKIYERTGLKVYDWQKNILKDVMALDEDNLWAHQKYGYSVPRRNGKTEIAYIVELWGLHHELKILHTAHRISTSHSSFEKLKKYLEKMGYIDGEDFVSNKAKGQERIEIPSTNSIIQFRTRSSSGGLGEGFDLLVIDEAQEYTVEQESALKYTVTDSQNPLTIFCGTPPTMVSIGTVFKDFRKSTLAGNEKYGGWAEWSIDTEKELDDVASWYITNPSLGYHLTERKIEAELGEDKLDHNIQRLGYWSETNLKSVISEQEWDRLAITTKPEFKGKKVLGVKFGQDGRNVAAAIAIETTDGHHFVEVIDCLSMRTKLDWIPTFIKKAKITNVVIDGANGQQILADLMKDFGIKKKPALPKVADIITANAMFEKDMVSDNIRHNNQPSLREVATNCKKRAIGTNGGFGYKSLYDDKDISLLDSCILANWLLTTVKNKKVQKIYY